MNELWRTSVHQCVSLFRDGLIAISPIAERARISWREPQAYDDWDRIAQALFQSIVSDTIAQARECKQWPNMICYDRRVLKYSEVYSYIFDAKEGHLAPLVCFETSQSPFDTCLLVRSDTAGTVATTFRKPFSQTALRATSGFGLLTTVDQLTVEI